MNREDFIRKSLALGLGLPFASSFLMSCGQDEFFPDFTTDFSGKVIIVGAGASGIAAGYLLSRLGIDFQILEASADFGGRVKRSNDFADFPIDLGAEWIHDSPTILSRIIDDSSVDATLDYITYNPQTFKVSKDGEVSRHNYASNFYSEIKFKNTTWYGFFEKFLIPAIKDRLVLNAPVNTIDYSGDRVELRTIDGTDYTADKVLVTIPIKILQHDYVTFIPALPEMKSAAINNVSMGHGLKAFLEFEEKFYPDLLMFDSLVEALSNDSRIYYDAAFRKDSKHHVLGLFTINEDAEKYATLNTDQEVIDVILSELDQAFDGAASRTFKKGIVQNWSKEPFIQGSYSYNFDGDQEDIVNQIKSPLDSKVYFAGEALSIDYQATVHGACDSGYEVVRDMLT